jgi:alpha,alpha-trehalase
MYVPFHEGVISQFQGYDQLAELDWHGYRERYGNIQRLDRILEAENDSVNRYRASKQADVLMLFYLLSSDELRELFARMGYRLTPEQIPKTVDYYLHRTSHGSTLSGVVHAWVLARGDRERAMRYFQQVLMSDVADIQGGTTAEGIHVAAMAGSIDLLQRCFTGLETRADRLILSPMWPESLGALRLPIFYRGYRLHLTTIPRSRSNAAVRCKPSRRERRCASREVSARCWCARRRHRPGRVTPGPTGHACAARCGSAPAPSPRRPRSAPPATAPHRRRRHR